MTLPVSPFVIGLTGPVGSGVTTLSLAMEENGFVRASLSAPIKEEFKRRKTAAGGVMELEFDEIHIQDYRKQLQDIGNEGREHNPHCWVEKALAGKEQVAHIVVDGIRNLHEVEYLRSRFSQQFFLVAVHASPDVRWSREKDVYDRNQKLFERDDARDADEESLHGQQVTKCVQMADYVLVNDGNDGSKGAQRSKLYSQIQEDIRLMQAATDSTASYRRTAKPDEVHMATAYAQSHMSQCLKRHVGAMIVNTDNLPLSLGYNENPIGMAPCVNAYHRCFKDDDMHAKLESFAGIRCPSCGTPQSELASPWLCSNADCKKDLKMAFFPSRNLELCTAIHAEERAIRSLHGRSAQGGTMFTTTFPCFQCSRYIVDAGIKRVVYVEAYPVKEAKEFLTKNRINVDPFEGFKARAFNLIFRQVG
ncbi:MAG: deoxycytidylate deaminase [Schlesneria sp.]|nr:deoxycytidylate deaminase [Schlesneria sp.]